MFSSEEGSELLLYETFGTLQLFIIISIVLPYQFRHKAT